MPIDTNELVARLCALEVEALNSLSPPLDSTAVPRWLYQQEQVPYWRNRIVSVVLDTTPDDNGEEVDVYVYTVAAALNLAPYSSGYDGENDEQLLQLIPAVIQYVDERELLQSLPYPDPMAFLRKAWFVSCSGYETFSLSAGGSVQIGCTFQWRMILERYVQQQY